MTSTELATRQVCVNTIMALRLQCPALSNSEIVCRDSSSFSVQYEARSEIKYFEVQRPTRAIAPPTFLVLQTKSRETRRTKELETMRPIIVNLQEIVGNRLSIFVELFRFNRRNVKEVIFAA